MLNLLYPAARAILFRLDAERAHHFSMAGLRASENLGILKALTTEPESKPISFAGLTFPNPVGLAAGLDKEANTIDALGLLGFGHIEVGTLTPKPQTGNESPRLFRLPQHKALINRMGFNNPGIDQGVANTRSASSFNGIVGINIGKRYLLHSISLQIYSAQSLQAKIYLEPPIAMWIFLASTLNMCKVKGA